MAVIDWAIVIVLLVFLTGFSIWTNRYTKSVADFLSANRCAGRYVLSVAEGIAMIGAIYIVASFEMYYSAGFVPQWWIIMMSPTILLMALSGWVIYRFRQTRALTLGQFFEIRYNKKFRIFAASICVFSGVINFGIFPGIGSRFFIQLCKLPEGFDVFGFTVSTYVFIMIILLAIALFFTFLGGQIAVIVTDFFQGAFCNFVFLCILALFLFKFDWTAIFESLSMAPKEKSMLNPFETGEVKSFNVWFYLIMYIGAFYSFMAWQGTQGYNASATSPHEARMARILGMWRNIGLTSIIVFVPICAYTVMHHPSYASLAESVQATLSGIDSPKLQLQMTTPIVLSHVLPIGLLGAFCAVMFAAFISTHDSYLHSWGSILIQDVVLPLRKKPFTTKQHLWLLRVSIFGVAVFIFCWSYWFRLEEHILMYFSVTGAIFLGGAGSAIIGGLYWKRGSTAAAFSAMIVGSTLAVAGIVVKFIYPDFFLHGQWMWGISMAAGISTYVLVSLLGPKTNFNMERLLHRGKYTIEENHPIGKTNDAPGRGWKIIGVGSEFTRKDKIIYIGAMCWTFGWWTVILTGTVYNFIMAKCGRPVRAESWATFWRVTIMLNFVFGTVITIWLAAGGIIDVRKLFKTLKKAKRNALDDGRVVDHHSLADEIRD